MRGIYGVKIYTRTDNKCDILFKKTTECPLMSNEIIEEANACYRNLDENAKKNAKFQIYRNCKSIDDKENCMIWWDIDPNNIHSY
jgi:hypothetical protein